MLVRGPGSTDSDEQDRFLTSCARALQISSKSRSCVHAFPSSARFPQMNLARYKAFVNRLQRDTTVTKGVSNIDVFPASGSIWYDLADLRVTDDRLIRFLKSTLRRGMHWRPQKSNAVYFPVISLDAVIVGTFPAPPRSTTRQRFCDNVQACLTGSNNEYDALHDHLTGLTNRAEFDSLLSEEVRHLKPDLNTDWE